MKPPLLIRVLPDRLKQTAFDRLYHPIHSKWRPLLTSAPLRYASGMTMVDLVFEDHISGSIAMTGFYELGLTRYIRTAALNGGLLVDVGANLGYFCLVWLSARSDNTGVAVEASPSNLPRLRKNLAANGVADRCEVYDVAASREDGVVEFDPGPAEQTGWGGLSTQSSCETIQVQALRLDKLLRDDRPISVLKIDVEGADTWVLLGADRLFRKGQVRTIYFEQNAERMQRLGVAAGEAQQYLTSFGYNVRRIAGEPGGNEEYEAVLP
jgi:FkbM family methyltransferase